MNLDHVIDGLKKHDKVGIDYKGNYYVGYVESMTDRHLTIHEYVPDVYRTFNREDILEIAEFTGKLHKHVLADIRKEVEELGEEIGQPIFRPSSYINSNNEETTKTGGNEIMEKDNLQEKLVEYELNNKAMIAAVAMEFVIEKDFTQDAIKEVLAETIKDELEVNFIDFYINLHDGTGVMRFREFYQYLNNGWKVTRVQNNFEVDGCYYFTLVRSEDSQTVGGTKNETKRTVDAREVYEIIQTLESGLYAEPPYILAELLHDGTRKPYEVTKERYVKFFAEVALSDLHELLKDHTDDEGNFKE